MVEKFDPNTWTGKVEVDGQEIELALVDEESAEGEVVPEAAVELELEPLPDGMYDVEPREEVTSVSDEIKVEEAPFREGFDLAQDQEDGMLINKKIDSMLANDESVNLEKLRNSPEDTVDRHLERFRQEEEDKKMFEEVPGLALNKKTEQIVPLEAVKLENKTREESKELNTDNATDYFHNVYYHTKPITEWVPDGNKRIKEMNAMLKRISGGKLGMENPYKKRADGTYGVEKIKYEKDLNEIPAGQVDSVLETLEKNEQEKSEDAFEYVKSDKDERYQNFSLGDHKKFYEALNNKDIKNTDLRKKITVGSLGLAAVSTLGGIAAAVSLASPLGIPVALVGGYGFLAGGALLRFGKGVYDGYKERKALRNYRDAFLAKGVRKQIST